MRLKYKSRKDKYNLDRIKHVYLGKFKKALTLWNKRSTNRFYEMWSLSEVVRNLKNNLGTKTNYKFKNYNIIR